MFLRNPCSWRADSPSATLLRCKNFQLVCHQNVGREALFREQFSHEFHRRVLVASSLHQKIENLAFIVDRAPQPELFAANQHGHLVEMPPRSRPMKPTAKLPGRNNGPNFNTHRLTDS